MKQDDSQSLMLTERQLEIFKGLKNIGEEIAYLFLDGVRLTKDDNYTSKAYILAHLAREIDGGLRDFLSNDKDKEKVKEELKKNNIDKELKEHIGHVASIISAIDVQFDHPIAQRWISIAINFAKYAHRHGPWKSVRDFSEIHALWDEYEEVLFWLVGSYYPKLLISRDF